jgi:hypothetical protein
MQVERRVVVAGERELHRHRLADVARGFDVAGDPRRDHVALARHRHHRAVGVLVVVHSGARREFAR